MKYGQQQNLILYTFLPQGRNLLVGVSLMCKGLFLFMRFDMKQIELSGKRGAGKFALVDDEDYEELNKFRWYYNQHGYVTRVSLVREGRRDKKHIQIHRVIMKTPRGMDTDHRDGDKLNNQKINLRICNRMQNSRNSKIQLNNKSGFTGVHNHCGKWQANITINKKRIVLGSYRNIEDAIIKRREAVLKYFGEYAHRLEVS